MVDRGIVSSASSAGHLVRRVADDHVELHIASKYLGEPSFDIVGVDKRIGVGSWALFGSKDWSGCPAVIPLLLGQPVFIHLEPVVPLFGGHPLAHDLLAL